MGWPAAGRRRRPRASGTGQSATLRVISKVGSCGFELGPLSLSQHCSSEICSQALMLTYPDSSLAEQGRAPESLAEMLSTDDECRNQRACN